MLACTGGALPPASNHLVGTISLSVLSELGGKNVFNNLDDLRFDTTSDNNHVFSLIKIISQYFIKIRMHSLSKKFSRNISGINVRKQL
jgi:hypothetical protein